MALHEGEPPILFNFYKYKFPEKIASLAQFIQSLGKDALKDIIDNPQVLVNAQATRRLIRKPREGHILVRQFSHTFSEQISRVKLEALAGDSFLTVETPQRYIEGVLYNQHGMKGSEGTEGAVLAVPRPISFALGAIAQRFEQQVR